MIIIITKRFVNTCYARTETGRSISEPETSGFCDVINYGYETWINSKEIIKKCNNFEEWYKRRMMKMNQTSQIMNIRYNTVPGLYTRLQNGVGEVSHLK